MKTIKENVIKMPSLSELTSDSNIESYIEELGYSNYRPGIKVPIYLGINKKVSLTYIPFVSFGIYEFILNKEWKVDRNLVKKAIEDAFYNYINRIIDGSWFEYIDDEFPGFSDIGYCCLYDDIPYKNKESWLMTIIQLSQYRSKGRDAFEIPEEIAKDVKLSIDENSAKFLMDKHSVNSGSLLRILDRDFTKNFSKHLKDIDSIIYLDKDEWYKNILDLLKEEFEYVPNPFLLLEQDRTNRYVRSYSVGRELKRAVFLDYRND